MKKLIALMAAGLMSYGAWAGTGILFGDNPDIRDSVLQQLDQPAGMGMKEKGEGDFYGTSLKAWGGDVSVGMAERERGSTDVYGSILLDVDPNLPY